MAELPEIQKYANQMHKTLAGRKVAKLALLQPKCANVPPEALNAAAEGQTIQAVGHKGKWFLLKLSGGNTLLLSLGMGADLRYYEKGTPLPEKYQIDMQLADGAGFTVRFWWFGNLNLWPTADLANEKNTGGIAPHPFESSFTPEYFRTLCAGKRGAVKTFLLNQKMIGGIGNFYAHDILFEARLHPKRGMATLTPAEIDALYNAIRAVLGTSAAQGSFDREYDFFGHPGGFGVEQFKVGYREGQPCPVCGKAIELIKTGGTSSFICPRCQPL